MARVDVRTDDGRWVVVVGEETHRGFERYRDAELKARQLVQSLGGGEVVTHGGGGQVIERQTVPGAAAGLPRSGGRFPRFNLRRA